MKIGKISEFEELNKELTWKFATEYMSKFEEELGSVHCKGILGKDLSKPEELELLNKEEAFDKICPNIVKTSTQILLQTFKTIDNEQQKLF